MKTNGDDLAYPFKVSDVQNYQHTEGGLTKREYFAALAMQSLLTKGFLITKSDLADCARDAILMADALIAELNKEQK